jgi:type I restriction enzyme S subunit
MKFGPYPKYKDSGVQWLGAVPEEWDITPLKHVASLQGRLGWQGLRADEYTDEGPYLVTSEHFSNERVDWARCYHVSPARYAQAPEIQLRADDLLMMKDGAAMGKLAYVEFIPGPACLNSHLLLFRPLMGRFLNRFLFYVLGGPSFESYMTQERTGTTFFGISQESIGTFRLALPPLEEQHRILELLNREVTRIDTLIAKQERLIAFLQEKRQALISHAVTKGLNPGAPMKPSGIEWLGDVPAHWAVTRLRRVADGGLINGLFKTKDSYGRGAPLVNVFDVYQRDSQIQPETLDRVETTSAEMEKYSVVAGDLLFVRSSLKLEGIGVSALVREVFEPTVFECHLVRLRPRRNLVVPRFLSLYLSAMPVRHRLVAAAQTTTMTTIGQEGIACLEVLLPPTPEQVQIIDHLDLETRKHDEIVVKAQRSIALMREHRTALISAAVTGKIDVREPSHA